MITIKTKKAVEGLPCFSITSTICSAQGLQNYQLWQQTEQRQEVAPTNVGLLITLQKLCEDEKELALMVDTMKKDLPASFRVTGFRSQATAVRNVIEGKYFKELADFVAADREVKREGRVACLFRDSIQLLR